MLAAGASTISIPGYRILGPLGQGGMATVYLAVQENFGREVALKLVSQRYRDDESFASRFMREARIVAQMRHSNIVSVFDVGNSDGQLYLSMELLEGGDLKSRIGSGMRETDAARICISLASALGYAHDKGFLHRDIKPENVLFRSDGTPVVTDFGIARALESTDSMTQSGVLVGTPSYMSPEQARGEQVDQRTDIYALGVVFFELLTGAVPYKATSAVSTALKHVSDPIPQLPEALAHWNTFLQRILAKEPAGRYQNCREVISALALYANITDIDNDSQTAIIHTAEMASLLRGQRELNAESPTSIGNNIRSRPRLLALVILTIAVGTVLYSLGLPRLQDYADLMGGEISPPHTASVIKPEPVAEKAPLSEPIQQGAPVLQESPRVDTPAVQSQKAEKPFDAEKASNYAPKPVARAELNIADIAPTAIERFITAVEAKDISRVKSVSVLAARNAQLLQALFLNYSEIHLQLASVTSVVNAKQLKARLAFVQLKNAQGQMVEAGDRWKYFDVIVRQSVAQHAQPQAEIVW